jgi:hypothetical protein
LPARDRFRLAAVGETERQNTGAFLAGVGIGFWPSFACQRNGRLKLGVFLHRRFDFGFCSFWKQKIRM